jgi:GNAT superfamily N-acetyltransferase
VQLEQSADGVSLALATLEDLPALVALNTQPTRCAPRRAHDAFHEQKLLAYLESPHAVVVVARCKQEAIGYIAAVINPEFAAGMRKPSRMLRQAALVCSGRYGFGIGVLRRIAQRAYERLWRDHQTQRRLSASDGARPTAWVNNIVVAQARRGKGIAGLLLDAVEAWARASGAAAIGADIVAGNAASLRAFQKAGFLVADGPAICHSARLRIVRKPLVP